MKLIRNRWTPITVVIETREEAEILHKILAHAADNTEEREAHFLDSLFYRLGENIDPGCRFKVASGDGLMIYDNPELDAP